MWCLKEKSYEMIYELERHCNKTKDFRSFHGYEISEKTQDKILHYFVLQHGRKKCILIKEYPRRKPKTLEIHHRRVRSKCFLCQIGRRKRIWYNIFPYRFITETTIMTRFSTVLNLKICNCYMRKTLWREHKRS